MGQIVLVRHGQAAFGTDDYDRLTDLGKQQSQLLGEWFAQRGRKIDCAVTGNMRRHRQTAESCLLAMPQALRPKGDWTADAGFDEYDADEVVVRHRPEFGDPGVLHKHLDACEHPRREFQAIFTAAMERWMGGRFDSDYRESWSAFSARCVASLTKLTNEAGPSRTTVVFTSGGPIAAICQHVLGLTCQRAFAVNTALVNSATTALLYQPRLISLSYLNNFSHLERTGNPQVITYR